MWFLVGNWHHRDRPGLTHAAPTRRSSELTLAPRNCNPRLKRKKRPLRLGRGLLQHFDRSCLDRRGHRAGGGCEVAGGRGRARGVGREAGGVARGDIGLSDRTREGLAGAGAIRTRRNAPVRLGGSYRSAERRVGKEGGRTCKSRWARY